VSQTGIASEFLHYGEEPILVPSYTIFFSGCTFECVFCQNWDISQVGCGIHIDPEKLARKIDLSLGINVNWVGGDPTPHLYYIFQVLTHCTRNIPQVWNSNMYCSLETMRLLNKVIDVYLTDFKFGNDKCAKRLSNVDNYWRIIRRNHLIAHKQGEIIVRHLVLPNHTNCCSRPILEWLAKNIPSAVINIMAQYRPCYKANQYNDIARSIYSEEYQAVLHHGKDLGLNLI
jgi:putative pyruvate formate lyase activating enzyme